MASRHLQRTQCILEQTNFLGPPTNSHVDFMWSVNSTVVSAPSGGMCLVVVESCYPWRIHQSPCTISLFENWCHFNLQLHICSPHINEVTTLTSQLNYWIKSRIKLDKIHQQGISLHTMAVNYSLNIRLSKFFGSRLHNLSIHNDHDTQFSHCPPMIERDNPLKWLLEGCLPLDLNIWKPMKIYNIFGLDPCGTWSACGIGPSKFESRLLRGSFYSDHTSWSSQTRQCNNRENNNKISFISS